MAPGAPIHLALGRNIRLRLSLTVEIFESPHNDLCGYPFDGTCGGQAACATDNTATLVYDMDWAENSFVVLRDLNNAGGGEGDLRVLIADSYFNQNPNCNAGGAGCTVYVTLYSEFGADSEPANGNPLLQIPHPNNGDFEQWAQP